MKKENIICNRCVMDSTIPNITFDSKGICSECTKYFDKLKAAPYYVGNGSEKLSKLLAEIKEKGKNNNYDCVVGLSGGIDSSYVMHLVVKNGLRPLVVHLDNGWNTEISERNIQNIISKLNLKMHSFKLDWDEFSDLQRSFLYSSTPHCEHPTDHAILGLIYKLAAENNIEYIISGSNVSTEGIGVSVGSVGQRDWKYIKRVHKLYGKQKLKSYPHFTMLKMTYYKVFKKQKTINILDYIDYDKEKVMEFLKSEYGWEYYGGKHYESVYTRFFQAYILPEKFNIDKRKAHYSSLIMSKQMERKEAIEELKNNPYPRGLLEKDKAEFLEKLNLTNEEFDKIMKLPIKSFEDYPSYEKSTWYKFIKKTYMTVKPIFKF